MKARLEGEDWAGLDEAIAEFRKLKPRDQFQSRLDQIRASMAGEQLAAAPAKPAVEAAPSDTPPVAAQPDASVSRLDELRASMARDTSGDQAAG